MFSIPPHSVVCASPRRIKCAPCAMDSIPEPQRRFTVSAGVAGSEMQSWFATAAAVCVINSAVASVYYIKVVTVIFFRTPLGTPQIESESDGPFLAAICSALAIVAVGLYPGPCVNLAWINGLPWPG